MNFGWEYGKLQIQYVFYGIQETRIDIEEAKKETITFSSKFMKKKGKKKKFIATTIPKCDNKSKKSNVVGLRGRELSTVYWIKRKKLPNSLRHTGPLCRKNFHRGVFLMMLFWLQKPNQENSCTRSFRMNTQTGSKYTNYLFGQVLALCGGICSLKINFGMETNLDYYCYLFF